MTDASRRRAMRGRVYGLIVAVDLAAIAGVLALPRDALAIDPAALLVLAFTAAIAASSPVRIPLVQTEVSGADAFLFAALAWVGGLAAAIVGVCTVAGATLGRKRPPKLDRLAFNLGCTSVAAIAGWGTFWRLGGVPGGPFGAQILPVVGAATVYFLVNTLLVSLVIRLDRPAPFRFIWSNSALWTAVSVYVGVSLGLGLLWLLHTVGAAGLALGLPPCWFLLRFFRVNKERIDRVLVSNTELEAKVRERTAALEAANRDLRDANASLEQANRAKNVFLANVSHELRTPLNAVIGFSDLMRDGSCGPLNAEQAEYAADIHDSGVHLLNLIDDILDLSKIEAGRLDVHLREVDVEQSVREAAGMLRLQAREKGLAFAVDCGIGERAARVDPGMFRQIVVNLSSNAVKFTPRGGRVDLEVREREGGLEIVVRDTGIGIALEHQAKVFEEFFQVDGSYSRSFQGTGLGLALVRRLVELHGGRLELESEEGRGSTFRATFPGCLVDGPVPGWVRDRDRAEAERRPGLGDTVLIVEDNPINMKLAATVLRSRGYRVVEATTAEDALRVLEQRVPDVILMDVQLPGMDGLEATRRIKRAVETRHVPVLALTANASEEDRRQALEAGCDGFHAKPLELERLLAEIAAAVDRARGDDAHLTIDSLDAALREGELDDDDRPPWVPGTSFSA